MLMKPTVVAPQVKRYLALGWGAAAVAGTAATITHYRTIPSTHPYLAEAVHKAQASLGNEISTTWKLPRTKMFQEFGYAETALSDGRRLLVEAKKVALGDVPSELLENPETRTLRFYWDNPWEVKFAVVRNARRIKATISDLLFPGSVEEIGNFKWEISRLTVRDSDGIEKTLMGEPIANAPIINVNPKSTFSRRRWQLISGSVLLGLGAFFARRRYLQKSIKPSFAELFIADNPLLEKVIGKNFQVVAKKGVFRNNLIDGSLELRGTREANVAFKAAKVGREWKILKAELTGPRPLSLV
jgi:hypothetical protein